MRQGTRGIEGLVLWLKHVKILAWSVQFNPTHAGIAESLANAGHKSLMPKCSHFHVGNTLFSVFRTGFVEVL